MLKTPEAKLTIHKSIKKEPLIHHIWQYRYIHLMLLPALVWLIIFKYIPIYGLTIAFQDFTIFKGYFKSPWVGLKHFEWLFNNPNFTRAFVNTWIINLGKLAIGFPSAVILALMINEIRINSLKKSFQTLTYLPHFISWVILSGIMNSLFAFESGALSHLLKSFGFVVPDFLQSNSWFRPFVVLSHVWKEMGWGSIIYLAAISGIDPQLYEASHVDGANRWQQLWKITLPGIAGTMTIVFILNLGSVLNWGFDQIFNLYSPLVYETGDIIQTFIIRNLQGNPNFSRLAAAGFIRSFIGMILLLVANKTAKHFGGSTLY